ncbi:MAG: trehalose-phosphatase [Chloroflexi bacterium]|nr:trehalose-phosphatase [Chloroflexota bacterium]
MSPDNLFQHLDEVEALLARCPFGLITDVDGTISEIAPSPAEARVSPRCREALARLVDKLAVVAAISGRPALEAREMVGVEGMVYLGNHGLEWVNEIGKLEFSPRAEEYRDQVKLALREISNVECCPGVLLEDKGLTGAVHYRMASDPEDARRDILISIALSPSASGLRITQGRKVIELRPPIDLNKGFAVEWLMREHGLSGAIYVGDDLTDVDAFGALHALSRGAFRGLALAVASGESPLPLLENADYVLEGVSEVERFLEWLAEKLS